MVKYYLPDRPGENAYDLPKCNSHCYISAMRAAQDYHNCHEGYEVDWPIKITLKEDDGSESTWEVDREMEPMFTPKRLLE